MADQSEIERRRAAMNEVRLRMKAREAALAEERQERLALVIRRSAADAGPGVPVAEALDQLRSVGSAEEE